MRVVLAIVLLLLGFMIWLLYGAISVMERNVNNINNSITQLQTSQKVLNDRMSRMVYFQKKTLIRPKRDN